MVSAADILNARILVVDDKEANVRLLEGMLRVAGYTSVESTTDPTEVCELHRQNRYSLILLDLQMPGMDGFQVMEGLKEIEGDGYLPVLVITAQPSHKLRALEAGAKDFVSKPFDLAELRARVHNILEVRLLHLRGEASQPRAGRDGTGAGSQPRGDPPEDPGGAKAERAGTGAGAGNSGKPAAPLSARSLRIFASTRSTSPRATWAAISTISCS